MRSRSTAHRWKAATACFLLMTPVPVVQTDAERTRETSLTLGAGSGAYDREVRFQAGMSDCGPITRTARFDADFTDFGADLEHRMAKNGSVGVRAGFIREKVELVPNQSVTVSVNVDSIATQVESTRDNFYLNPYIAKEGSWLGVGGGVIVASQPLRLGDDEEHPADEGPHVALSGHLRVGKRSRLYASTSAGENVPIYSGGGFFNYGVGIDIPVGVDLWVGQTLGPWRKEELLMKADVHPSPHWSLGASFRLGSDAPEPLTSSGRQYGASVRLTRRFPH